MRIQLFAFLFSITCLSLSAQRYFPVKVDKSWGLIDAEGSLVLDPVYDAIGEFKHFGFAVMQRAGKVGLLGPQGLEVIKPIYDDIKVLDTDLIAVMEEMDWRVINLKGETILKEGYDQVQVWDHQYVAYLVQNKWGLVHKSGKEITAPVFDEIYLKGKYFYTQIGKEKGLLMLDGTAIITPSAEEIKPFNDSLIFYKQDNLWGAVHQSGKVLLPPEYDYFSSLSDNFIKLLQKGKYGVYSISCQNVITLGEYDDFYPFSRRYIISKKDRRLGLLDWCGQEVLPTAYDEIQPYEGKFFRVNLEGKWGVVDAEQEMIIPFGYDYIAPLKGRVCIVKKGNLFGVANASGEEIVPTRFHRIELENKEGRAYVRKVGPSNEEALTLLRFNEEGQLVDNNNFNQHFTIKIGKKAEGPLNKSPQEEGNNYVMEGFEWFYSPQEDRWGLRKLEDGSVHIEPKFHTVNVRKDLGFTLVGIEKYSKSEFERTTYRLEMIYGLVKNDMGLLVTEVDFWDVRFEDFEAGHPVARVVFSDGKHGLIDKIGKIIRRDMAYIGAFHFGVARMSLRGKLSGSMKPGRGLGTLQDYLSDLEAPNYMIDYTQYDRLFQNEAYLICEGCEWGYIDTEGKVIVPPKYNFAMDFVNEVGIVSCGEKWGMVGKNAKELIPCNYDGVKFLDNTDNKIVQVYIQQPQYGLIDTLGDLKVKAVYEEIGSFSEGRLAVKRKGLWGYVNRNGLEVIPCRFREVQNFSMGLAAVKLGNNWGFIDKQGNTEIDFKYIRTGNFEEGLAWVYTDDGVAYINKTEEVVIPAQFDKAFDFDQGVARVVQEGKFGLIDATGRFIQRPKYTDIKAFNRYGLAIAKYGNDRVRYGIINLQGDLITNTAYLLIEPYKEGLAVVKTKSGYGYIDLQGNLVISDKYSKAASFSESRAAVQQKGMCGYIDRQGKPVINFEFSKCLDFDGGRAVVYKGIRKAGLVDLAGNFILKPSVNRLLKFKEGRGLVRDEKYRFYYITEQAGLYDGFYQRATEFQHGVAVVQLGGKWGIINQKGIEVIPPKYDKIESFENGFAKVRIKGFKGLSNLKGELIVQPDFEYISYAGEGLFRVEQGDKVGYFDMDGKWVWSLSK